MENVYIFDLDNTLYSFPPGKKYFDYSFLKYDPELRNLLLNLGNCYIFTNGNYRHLEFCINKIGLRGCFKNATYQDLFNGFLKPMLHPYIITHNRFDLLNKKVFFFEDCLENLKTAKSFGWTTIYINQKLPFKKPFYVNHMFTDIKTAIKNLPFK